MRRIFAATCCLTAWGFLVAVGAQTPPPADWQQDEQNDKTVTLTGCLAAGEEPGSFKLTNVQSPEETPAPGEMVGTTGVKHGGSVALIGTGEVELEGHVGHKVEVTGMVVPRQEGQRTPIGAAPAGQPQPEAPLQEEPDAADEEADVRLNVKSFKHVDATCPPATN